jgi:hypothetical protein
MQRLMFATIALCSLTPCTVRAQVQDATSLVPQHPKSFCVLAAPVPQCSSFLITEAHARYRVSSGAGQSAFYLTAEVGWMKNLGNVAVGFTVFGGHDFGFETGRAGLKGRYRRWLGGSHRIDLSAGLLLSSEGTELFGLAGPGVVVGLGYTLNDWLHLSAELDYAPAEGSPVPLCGPDSPGGLDCEWASYYDGPSTPSLYIGAGVGKKAGLFSYALAALVGILAASMGSMTISMG